MQLLLLLLLLHHHVLEIPLAQLQVQQLLAHGGRVGRHAINRAFCAVFALHVQVVDVLEALIRKDEVLVLEDDALHLDCLCSQHVRLPEDHEVQVAQVRQRFRVVQLEPLVIVVSRRRLRTRKVLHYVQPVLLVEHTQVHQGVQDRWNP